MISEGILTAVILAVTIVTIAELIRRYYMAKFEYEYKMARLDYNEMIVPDGGEEDHDD